MPLPDPRRIEALERHDAALLARAFGGRDDARGAIRQVYLAITAASSAQSGQTPERYPSPAAVQGKTPNAFPIKFLEPWFLPEEPGHAKLDYRLGDANDRQAVAISLAGKYIPEDTVVAVLYQRGKEPGAVGHWYILDGTATDDLVHFRLEEPLACGQSAKARVITWDTAEEMFVDGRQIRVFDDYGDRAVKGSAEYVAQYRGWARNRGSLGEPLQNAEPLEEYSIIEIDQQARFIEGLATYPVDANSYLITLQRWYDGRKPEVVQVNEVRVVDRPGPFDGDLFFPKIPLGSYARIKAIWDPCAGEYRVWQAQQMCPMFRTVAKKAFCGNDIIVEIDSTFFEPYWFSPFNLLPNPLPGVAINSHDLAAMDDDVLTVHWHEDTQQWIIIQVEHHPVDIITEIKQGDPQGSQGGTSCEIRIKKRQVWVPLCPDQGTWATGIAFVEHVAVESLDLVGCELKANLRAFCALPSDTDAGTQTVFTIGGFPVVDDVYVGGNKLRQHITCVPFINEALGECCDYDVDEDILQFTTCTSSSAQ